MIDSLRQERGQARMNTNNATHRRPEVAATSRPFATPASTASTSSATAEKTLDLAKQHRDKLLSYQAENARRTHIIDQAADFETPKSGQSMWSSPVERAAQLKRQQKVLREQEWNAKPEYEKRKVVVSVDLVGGKVVRRMANKEKPEEVEEHVEDAEAPQEIDTRVSGGAFSKNPLMGGLTRPVWKRNDENTLGDGAEEEKENQPRKNAWRRVQDENDDNEAWILDGGVYGGKDYGWSLRGEESPCG